MTVTRHRASWGNCPHAMSRQCRSFQIWEHLGLVVLNPQWSTHAQKEGSYRAGKSKAKRN